MDLSSNDFTRLNDEPPPARLPDEIDSRPQWLRATDSATEEALIVAVQSEARRRRIKHAIVVAIGSLLMAVSMAYSADVPLTEPSTPPPATTPVPSQSLAQQIAARINPLLPDGVRLQGVTLGCTLPEGAALTTVAPGLTRIISRGVVVEFQAGNRTIMCSASIDAQRQIMVAARDIQSNEAVGDRDFVPQWVDAYGGPSSALTSVPNQGPYASTSFIRAGQPLFPNEIARPVLVHPGELVMVLVKNGPITVRAHLQSQSSAAFGEAATLINPTSGTPVVATVTGPKSAEMVMQ